MARIEIAAGRRQDALTWARQAAESHPRSAQAMLMIAETQMEAGKTSEAMVSAQQALNLQPRDARALRALGQMQMTAKDYVGAATTFNSLVRAQPGSVDAHTLLASALLASGDVTTALSVARNSIKPDPRNSEARALLADVLMQGRKFGDALEFARQAQRDSPKSAFGFRLEAEALLAQGDARRAAKVFESAAKLEPSGYLLTRMHQAQSAATPGAAPDAQLEEWVRKNPEDIRTRMYLATVLSATGRKTDAIAHYQDVVRRDGKNSRALNNLAWALHAVGDAQAVTYAEQAYQLEPTEAAVADTFGWILVGRGRLHEGIQVLLKAVTLDGKNPEIRYHLGKALAQAGDKSRARTELKTALNVGKPFPQVDDARALLVSLGPQHSQ
jgi:putative PEP-CTERM system TPR-repeat lipoprotein